MGESHFTHYRLAADLPARTLSAQDTMLHWSEFRRMSLAEWIRLGTFPEDYTFRSPARGKYIIGMSVPPLMAEFVARAVCSQWLGVEDGGRRNRGNLPGSGR